MGENLCPYSSMAEYQSFKLSIFGSIPSGGILKLQDFSGLTDRDPLYRYLGIVDKFLGEYDWLDVGHTLPVGEIQQGLFLCFGKFKLQVSDDSLDSFEEYLKLNEEIELAEIISKLRKRIGQEEIDNNGIRAVVLFIVANIDYLKEKYLKSAGKVNRKITSNWKVSEEIYSPVVKLIS